MHVQAIRSSGSHIVGVVWLNTVVASSGSSGYSVAVEALAHKFGLLTTLWDSPCVESVQSQ